MIISIISILGGFVILLPIPSIPHLHCICAGPVLRHRPQPLRRGRQGGPVSAFAPRPRRSAAVRGLKRRDPNQISTENMSSLEVAGKTNNNRDAYSRTNKNKMISFGGIPNSRSVLFLQIFLQRAAKPSARNTSAGFPWVKWPPCPPLRHQYDKFHEILL